MLLFFSSKPRGVIPPHSSEKIPVTILAKFTGRLHHVLRITVFGSSHAPLVSGTVAAFLVICATLRLNEMINECSFMNHSKTPFFFCSVEGGDLVMCRSRSSRLHSEPTVGLWQNPGSEGRHHNSAALKPLPYSSQL